MQDLITNYKIPKGFRGRSKLVVQLWMTTYVFLFRPSPQVLYGWRRFLLRLFGAKIGKKVVIRPTVEITYPWKVSIGDYCWIGDNASLYSLGEIVIGSHSVISQKCYLCTGSHNYNHIDFNIYSQKIVIEEQCWLATDVFVAPGTTIGKGTVVGSRSSVFNDLPSGKICVGTPAKVLKDREIQK